VFVKKNLMIEHTVRPSEGCVKLGCGAVDSSLTSADVIVAALPARSVQVSGGWVSDEKACDGEANGLTAGRAMMSWVMDVCMDRGGPDTP
jgi:hypothetical protein